MALALISGPQDPSQLDNLLNQVITYINSGFNGSVALAQRITAGTTAAPLPAAGVVTLSSTVASAAYTISRPVVGQTVSLVTVSTKSQTVGVPTGVTFNKSNTKLTFKTTNGAAGLDIWQSVTLTALSTLVWAITGANGTVRST